ARAEELRDDARRDEPALRELRACCPEPARVAPPRGPGLLLTGPDRLAARRRPARGRQRRATAAAADRENAERHLPVHGRRPEPGGHVGPETRPGAPPRSERPRKY